MTDITIPAAFGAGLLSFLSPCVLPLAPPYLCWLAGTSFESVVDEEESVARRSVIFASLLFVAGFTTVFVAFGATASAFGSVLRSYSRELSILAGLGIAVMGLHFLGVFRISALMREARVEVTKPPGRWAAYLMGLAFAFGWTPCNGPILGAILAVAGAQDTVGRGAGLLAIYAAGLGVPFVAAAFAMGPFLRFSKRFRSQFSRIEKGLGAALVVTGIVFLTGGMQAASGRLLEWFPILERFV